MFTFKKGNQNEIEPNRKLFEGEREIVISSIIGFILAGFSAFYVFYYGADIPPEGNMKDAFSFNMALALFSLSIAAILPLTRFSPGKRKMIRWFFIAASLYAYAIETIQNFRGFNPRFSREGEVIDTVAGLLFGIISIILVAVTVILAIHFLRMKRPFDRPLLLTGIRYAFLSVILANAAGIWMIVLQDRLTGDAGNLIVLHGIGFHALQTLIVPAWLMEKIQIAEHVKTRLLHSGSIAWMVMILLITIQTAMGRSVFELAALPILASVCLLFWLATAMIAMSMFVKQKTVSIHLVDKSPITNG